MNKNFWSKMRWFCNKFYEMMKSQEKIIAFLMSNKIMSESQEWQKIVIPVNSFIVLFYTCCLMSWTHNFTKYNYRSIISPLLLSIIFSDLALWHYCCWSLMSCKREVPSLSYHIHQWFFHGQIGAKAIYTSEQKLTISINHLVFTD